jgi:hypothetical protein
VLPSGIELMLPCAWPFPNRSNSLGFWTGSGRSRIALSSAKMAVLAPMPSVRERMAVKAKPAIFEVVADRIGHPERAIQTTMCLDSPGNPP